jgi:tRNA-Thr(GGU) m(6)t(6)A37 methyltransferase TsaA
MNIQLKAVAFVKNSRTKPVDDHWETIVSEIELDESMPTEVFDGISGFSHLEVIYYFDQVAKEDLAFAGHPRGNPDYPKVGIFAQRKKDRPNALGLCTVKLLKHEGRKITVQYLDAIDGTPVLDIKPVFREFQPKGEIRQADWVQDLMKHYWS